nr:pentatricopeptide repeat-containing protein At3g24000, mitochondrial-like isoform X2 [Ziziphus jujuba var. spinosa]XP_048333308.1 pentatricopeptide repeat-containing protein At3g24000, mitochondrial-like isoform X2 [Ziziphus jujuba var. spinosa]XP_048333309.1 pentatricopeptide repeat-containing protein At3g24000, mitochondrial-like isoform X2 [Ziziphus jujuba var. spinosa]XP_048333310.1 pentatricopeptide repeat-containing protein At3g24000, mitochondrial-like isoform X2 [Ziziphus jujuba var. 
MWIILMVSSIQPGDVAVLFNALKMVGPPTGFRSLLLPICQVRISPPWSSVPSFFQVTYQSCSAVNLTVSNPTDDLAFKVIPGKFSNGSSPSSIKIEKNVRSKPFKFDSKERLRHFSEMLHACASKRCLNEAMAIHGQVIRSGIDPDSHLWVSLVNVYAKCGRPVIAWKVLDKMPERDVVSWTALIQGFVAEGYGSDGVNLFSEMKKDGIKPNEFTLATGLKACSVCLDLEFGKQLHAEAIKVGFFSDLFIGSALVDLYGKCGAMELADGVFFCMPEQNAVSWNALLSGYAQEGNGEKVLELFYRMIESEMRLSNFTLSTVLKGCANSGRLREGQVVHSLAIKGGCELDEILGCSFVDMYSKCGLAIDALNVFMRIKNPDVVAWSAMITCLDKQGLWQEAAYLFRLMRSKGVRPNHFSFSSILSSASHLGDLRFGESIHACIWKFGFENEVLVSNALISMYTKNGSIQDGTQVFEAMKIRDLVSWNALLSGFHDEELCNLGPKIFHQLLVEGFKPNIYTFISILRCCSSLMDVGFGKQIHAHTVKNSLDDNDFVRTALVDMYAKTRLLEDADVVFHRLTNPDLFTWTAIITGYAQTGQAEKAVNCFRKMQREGVKPNEFTLAGCLSACSHIATLENGRQLHSMAIKHGHIEDLFVGSALVDMYAKCGCIEDADAIFEGLVSRDTISWNTIICGYSQHGLEEKALEAFEMMLDQGIIPDEVTFIGIFSACSHLGLVDEGKKHFKSMIEIFKINPIIEHYACIVDILGRAGRFDEVENFIKAMKLAPYSIIWETVLGACKLHGNVELGERAAAKLFEIKPEMDATYILLSNIFAAKGRWDDVRKVRKLMSSQDVKKEPGCSWVEVDGQVHVFVSQDCSHPRIGDIYLKLEELDKKLASAGYIPETANVLHNVTETEKKEHLQYHSERLALGFALISTNPLKTIRIFKNLRICGNCHDVMKLISNIMNREIIVRDIKMFHHFKAGTCSCHDFW